jgi:RNA polymerase sigma-70 factor (ECF subfamily)
MSMGGLGDGRVASRPDVEQIYREHHTFVWRVVRRLGVPTDLVDDVVQEVFVVVHRRRDELARRIAARARERAVATTTLQLVPRADPRPDAETRLATEQKAEVVRRALDAMDEDKRMTFVLAEVEGMTMPEVAECLGVNLNTAYARQRAALKLVRAAIARHQAREEGERVRARRR